jgi:hypothetical protein
LYVCLHSLLGDKSRTVDVDAVVCRLDLRIGSQFVNARREMDNASAGTHGGLPFCRLGEQLQSRLNDAGQGKHCVLAPRRCHNLPTMLDQGPT